MKDPRGRVAATRAFTTSAVAPNFLSTFFTLVHSTVHLQRHDSYQNNSPYPRSCEDHDKMFTKSWNENLGNIQICGSYLEQLASLQHPIIYNVVLVFM